MIACVDVQYNDDKAGTAVVLFSDWTSSKATAHYCEKIDCRASYVPGQFYKRELPCVLSILKAIPAEPSVLLIDGYVWLGPADVDRRQPGFGAHLFDALNQRIAIVGAAKNPFKSTEAIQICRGTSKRPLYISAAGIDVRFAAQCVAQMPGQHRLPTMVKLADQLARQAVRFRLP